MKYISSLLNLTLLFSVGSTFSQNITIEDEVKKTLNKFPVKTQFSIALVDNENVTYLGFIKQKEGITSVQNQNDVFEIGSITKTFTATVLAQLVMDGKLNLTDNIAQFFPFALSQNDTITLLNLANHTSGLPRLPSNLEFASTDNPYKNYNATLLENYLQNSIKLNQKVGEKYEYSNLGAGLLGYVLGKSQKSSIEKLIQQYVLKKYGMKFTFVNRSDNKKQVLVKGLNQFGFETPYWDLNVLFGAGGMLSTSSDLAKFMQAHFDINNKTLNLTREATFEVSSKMNIGLAWHILKRENNQEWIWHNGGTGGFSSSMVMDLMNKKGVVILSNISAMHKENQQIDLLAIQILELLNKI